MTHICVGNLTIIGSDNGLSPGRRQAITWINVGTLLIGPLGTNFSEMLIGIHTFSFKKIHLKMSSGKWRPIRLGLNMLIPYILPSHTHKDTHIHIHTHTCSHLHRYYYILNGYIIFNKVFLNSFNGTIEDEKPSSIASHKTWHEMISK